MVSITGIVWNSENRGEETVKLILLDQLTLYHVHQAQVGQPEFRNHGKGQEGKDSKWSWGQVARAGGSPLHLWRRAPEPSFTP